MKRLILSISTLILIISSCFGIFYFERNKKLEILENAILSSEIVHFKYDYGSYFMGYFEYDISKSNEKTTLTAHGYNGVDLNINTEINSSALNDILEIVKEQNIVSWNNFSKSDDNILDGYSFSLYIEFKNGETINAHGYEKYPKNYDIAHKALSNYLEKLK